VTYTYEAGLRGQNNIAYGQLNWTLGAFHALNTNDILAVASPISFPYLNLTDPRTFLPGMPFAAYVGVRGTLPSGGAVFADASPILTKARQTGWAGAASPAADWTGIYVGVNGGFTFGGSAWSDSVTGSSSGSFRTSGFVFGGTVGANYQAGSLVFGVEADSDWADASESLCWRLPDDKHLAQHRARPRRLRVRSVSGLRHRRRLVWQRPRKLHQRRYQRREQDGLDGRHGNRGRVGSKLERQGGISLRRSWKWIVHHRLRHRQCSRTGYYSQHRGQV